MWVPALFKQRSTHARTIKVHNCSMFDFNHSSALVRTFCEAERRLVISIDFTVALSLRVGAVGEGDIYIYCFYLFFVVDRFEKVNVIFLPRDICICIVDTRREVWVFWVVVFMVRSERSPTIHWDCDSECNFFKRCH